MNGRLTPECTVLLTARPDKPVTGSRRVMQGRGLYLDETEVGKRESLKSIPRSVFVVEHDVEGSGLEKKKVIPTGGQAANCTRSYQMG